MFNLIIQHCFGLHYYKSNLLLQLQQLLALFDQWIIVNREGMSLSDLFCLTDQLVRLTQLACSSEFRIDDT